MVARNPFLLTVLKSGGESWIEFDAVTILFAAAVAGLLIWWLRSRRIARRRKITRAFNALAEEIIAATSGGEIAERLAAALPRIVPVTAVRVFQYERGGRVLRLIGPAEGETQLAVPLDSRDSAVAFAFRNRALLPIVDLEHSPLAASFGPPETARALLVVPMLRGDGAGGVLEMACAKRVREFTPDERAGAQHVANQVGAALGLIEQQSVREQVFRSEKLAATGQLISEVAGELRAPIEAIQDLANRLLDLSGASGAREIETVAREARRAAEIVSRLVSFARADPGEPRPLDLLDLLRTVIEFRQREWAARGIALRNLLPERAATVQGVEGQLEQVFLSLLVYAEQAVAGQADPTITVGAAVMGGKTHVEISYPRQADATGGERSLEESGYGLAVSRGVLRGLEGDLRLVTAPGEERLEVSLPLAAPAGAEDGTGAEPVSAVRPMTLILVDPAPAAARELVALAVSRGHRAVPVASAEEAAALAEKFRFDGVLCGVRLPGMSWAELFDRLRASVPTRVLVTEGSNESLEREVAASGGSILRKPLSAAGLDRALSASALRTVVE